MRIRVYGKVQGVFFRQSAKEQAKRLGITGFARNEPDGTVYIEAEGSEETLKEFRQWCTEGSRAADVQDVEADTDEPKHYEDFTTY